MTLPAETLAAIADELAAAERDRTTVPLLTARHPGMTVEDAYAVQREWRRRAVVAGRRPVGRKIGLTSKVMQVATGIDEPDYGAIFADMVYEDGVGDRARPVLERPHRGRARVPPGRARSRART